ncbi:hypothetical protein CONPUDRAFT_62312, partial [Coniophora puteana RWD-64-598 SS2]
NHASFLDHINFLLEYINSKLSAGHCSGPFTCDQLESLIRPFCTGPLSVIPKPGPSKFCLVQDH